MEFLIAVLIFAITTGITPGPNNIMIMTSGLNFGVRNSLPHYLGICFGFPAMVVLIGFGFGFVFAFVPKCDAGPAGQPHSCGAGRLSNCEFWPPKSKLSLLSRPSSASSSPSPSPFHRMHLEFLQRQHRV